VSTAGDWLALVGVVCAFVHIYLWNKKPDTAWLVTRWTLKVAWFCVKWGVVLVLVFIVGAWLAGLSGGTLLALIAFIWLWAMANHAEKQDARIRELERRAGDSAAVREAKLYTGLYRD
jgi:uncharacterized membrane protein